MDLSDKSGQLEDAFAQPPRGNVLKYRDNDPRFAEVREGGRVGVPCTVVNDGEKIIFGQPDLNELK